MSSWSLACCCGPSNNGCPAQTQCCEPFVRSIPAGDFDGLFQGPQAFASLLDRVEVEALACERATAEMAPGLLAMAAFHSMEELDASRTVPRAGKLSDHIAAESLGDLSVRFMSCELLAATNNFEAANELGSGTFGKVYRGRLWSGTAVAVKVLPGASEETGFEDEVRVLSRLRHPNLVTLLGWGQDYERDTRFLVYELLPGGDLGMRLTTCQLGQSEFFWEDRLLVSIDTARGLSYMVNSTPKVFHRDIKPPNILLDARGNAKVSDFGLARVARDIWASHMSIRDGAGTPGYFSPELAHTGEVTEQSEVYSFGMVFLELLVNLLPAATTPEGDMINPIFDIVQPFAPGAVTRLLRNLDYRAGWPCLVTDKLGVFALDCAHEQPTRRPCFRSIVADLEWAHANALQTAVPGFKAATVLRNGDQQTYVQKTSPLPRASSDADPPQRTCPVHTDNADAFGSAFGSRRLAPLVEDLEELDEDLGQLCVRSLNPDNDRLREAFMVGSAICELADANQNTPEGIINNWHEKSQAGHHMRRNTPEGINNTLPVKTKAGHQRKRPPMSSGVSAWARQKANIGSVKGILQPILA